jgi:hypothetical protein
MCRISKQGVPSSSSTSVASRRLLTFLHVLGLQPPEWVAQRGGHARQRRPRAAARQAPAGFVAAAGAGGVDGGGADAAVPGRPPVAAPRVAGLCGRPRPAREIGLIALKT